MKTYSIKVIYNSEDNLDDLISKKLGKTIKNRTVNKKTGEVILEFVYNSSKDANLSRFLVKKIPRDTKLRIEHG
jgi:hypothetical protein